MTHNPETTKLPKKQKRMLGFIAFTSIVTILGAVILGAYAVVNYRYEAAPKGEVNETVFVVPRGSGLSSIASRLEEDGLIKSAFIFKLVTKLRGNEGSFKAGEFVISQPASMSKIYETLAEGKAVLYPFTAPEGLTSAQIMRLMGSVQTLTGDMPETPAEGTMLPETYMTPRGMARAALVKQMQDAQRQVIDELWETRQEGLPLKSKNEALILASIVEKETGVGAERDVVAGVFINRLKIGMRLQTDPTIIYGISKGEPLYNKKGQRRTLYRSEIDRKTPWNTYQIDGLPPTPICNPGEEAIAAVLQPAKTDYLFFVADGTGGHVFAKTNREHVNNVNKWRKIERSRQRKQRAGQ
ncbi:endolytic transglycosylase MltG [Hellea balneolensis]|uniref:endolytic transglycosylase MltG n=1 Tax=Hellea balneolensis TaxID=287478 RepID=UPI001F2AC0AE|nr:endolytic transglycosylase MltG [Hellea balneolensis]